MISQFCFVLNTWDLRCKWNLSGILVGRGSANRGIILHNCYDDRYMFDLINVYNAKPTRVQ